MARDELIVKLQIFGCEHQFGEDFGILRIDLRRPPLDSVHAETEVGERAEEGR